MKINFRKKEIIFYVSLIFLLIGFLLLGNIFSNILEINGNESSLWAIFSLIFSIFNLILLVGILFLLIKYIIRFYFDRKGVKFLSLKTKLTFIFFMVSLVPTVVFIFFSYRVVSENFNRLFSTPAEEILKDAKEIENKYFETEISDMKKYLNEVDKNKKVEKGYKLYVLNGRNEIVLASDPYFKLKKWIINEIVELLKKNVKTVSFIYSRPDKDFVIGGKKIDNGVLVLVKKIPGKVSYGGYRINVAYSKFLNFRKRLNLVKSNYYMGILAIGFLLFFGFGWFGYFLSKKFSEPLIELSEAAERVGRGDLSKNVSVNSTDEFGILAKSFNKMMQEIKENRDALLIKNEELKGRADFIEAVINTIDTGFLYVDSNFNITIMNLKGGRLLGIENKSGSVFLDEPIPLMKYAEREKFNILKKLLNDCLDSGYVAKEIKISGDFIYTFRVSYLEINIEEKGFVVVFDDITEQVKAEKAIAWQDVAKRLAHEIKNPLTPVQLGAERIEKQFKKMMGEKLIFNRDELLKLGEVISESVSDIKRETRVLKYMIDEFSKFAKLPHPKREKVNLMDLIKKRLDSYVNQNKNISFDFSYDEDVELFIDAVLFDRMISNLIDNGIDAIKQSGKVGKIFLNLIRDKNRVFLDIGNDGPRIPDKIAKEIFLPNFSTKKSGMGIGLTIAKKIAEDHGFFLYLYKNNEKDGVVFRIEMEI